MIQMFAASLVLNSETQVLQANSCGFGFFFFYLYLENASYQSYKMPEIRPHAQSSLNPYRTHHVRVQ